MVNTQLLDYIKQQLAQGLSKEAIYTNLASSGGWNPSDINEAFLALGVNMSGASGPSGTMPIVPLKYAGFWIRWVAIIVDGLILSPIGFVIGFLFGFIAATIGLNNGLILILSYIIGLLINWSYFVLMTYYKGATLGKMLVGINVKSDDFQKLSFSSVLVRETIGKFVSMIILGIGYIMAGFTQKKQALHDKIAHSVVVYKDPSKSHRAGLIVGIILAAILPAIAIIGILASVVLASLNVARHRAQDAKTKADLVQIMANAEVYYGNNNNSYSQTKNCNSGMFLEQNIQQSISDIASKDMTCYAEGQTFAISAKLSDPTQSYCTDSSGYSDNGIAFDNGSTASCQKTENSAQNQDLQSQATGGFVTNPSYSYTLPNGWQSVSDIEGIQATNKNNGYVLSISVLPVSANMGKVISITDVMNPNSMDSITKLEFPTAIMGGSILGTIGGEKAIITTFSATVATTVGGVQKQSNPLSMLQYNAVHKGIVYTIIFMSVSSQQQVAVSDFQAIVNSFIFK